MANFIEFLTKLYNSNCYSCMNLTKQSGANNKESKSPSVKKILAQLLMQEHNVCTFYSNPIKISKIQFANNHYGCTYITTGQTDRQHVP